MTDSFRIGDRDLIPLKDVGKIVPYSRDYVARLARDGKIAAAQFNRQWYIDAESLKSFFEHAQLEMQARIEYTRALRKQELDLHEWWAAFEQNQAEQKIKRPARALGRTIMVIILGMFVGMMLVRFAPLASPAGLANLIVQYPNVAQLVAPYPDVVVDSGGEMLWFEAGDVSTAEEPLEMTAGLLLLGDGSSSSLSTTSIQDLFSDPVVYEETSSTTGTISLPQSSTTIPVVRVPQVQLEQAEEAGNSRDIP
jgi:hypothetical protein